MGSGSSKISRSGGGGATKPNPNDSDLTREFLDGIANSETDTQVALSSAFAGSKFSLLLDSGEKIEYRKLSDDWDGDWQETVTSNGNITSQMVVGVDRAAAAAFNNRADVATMDFKAIQAIPKSQVTVRTSQYVGAHRKAPSGRGTWAFDIGGRQVFISGKYSDAKKQAIAQAAAKGIRQIMTLS